MVGRGHLGHLQRHLRSRRMSLDIYSQRVSMAVARLVFPVNYSPSSWAPESSSSTLLRGGNKDGLVGRCASVILESVFSSSQCDTFVQIVKGPGLVSHRINNAVFSRSYRVDQHPKLARCTSLVISWARLLADPVSAAYSA